MIAMRIRAAAAVGVVEPGVDPRTFRFQVESYVSARIDPCRLIRIMPAQGIRDDTSRHECVLDEHARRSNQLDIQPVAAVIRT